MYTQSSGPAVVTCENTFINPLGLQDENDAVNKSRRKRQILRSRRQAGAGNQQLSENITLVSWTYLLYDHDNDINSFAYRAANFPAPF